MESRVSANARQQNASPVSLLLLLLMMSRLLLLSLGLSLIDIFTRISCAASPSLQFMGRDLIQNSYVNLNRIGNSDSTVTLQCISDLARCCDIAFDRGDWFYPDGNRVPRGFNRGDIYALRILPARVELRRQNNASEPSGIYRCEIGTIASVSSGLARESIYVGVYSSGGEVVAEGIRFTDFSLICNTSGGPPTTVTWSRDSIALDIETTSVLNDPVNAHYTHTLQLPNGVVNGTYSCNVSNVISTSSIDVTIGTTDVDCGMPPELENGAVFNLLDNSVVTYKCNEGYDIGGVSSRMCLDNSSWSDEEIVCRVEKITVEPSPTAMAPAANLCEGDISCWLSAGAMAGVAVAIIVIILLFLVALVVLFIILRRRRKKTRQMSLTLQPPVVECLYAESGESVVHSPPAPELPHVKEIELELKEKNMLFQKSHIELGRVIGQGESGLVYCGYIKKGSVKDYVAIKTGKALSSKRDREKLMKEVCIMINFHHPNVMSLIGLSFDGETPLLIMPFMSKGDLLSYIRGNRDVLYILDPDNTTEVEAARKACLGICHQISKGMSYLATVKYVHRDLAARNCMIDDHGIIKVSDFGLTEDMYSTDYYRQDDETGREEKLPIKWMAPESIETHVFDEKTDMWSFGVTCWEVFTSGGVPYTGVPVTTLLSELRSGYRLDRPSNAACSDDIWSVVTSCWAANPNDRLTFAALVKYLTSLLDTDPNYIALTHLDSHTLVT